MLTDLLHRLRALFRPGAADRDLDDELAFHLAREADKYEKAGAPPAAAARMARLRFGGLDDVTEACRDARGVGWVDQTRRNLRYAFRLLRKQPGFAAVAIATLAIGIGANSAVFSAIDTILVRPLAFPQGDELMRLEQYEPKSANPSTPVAPIRLEDWNRLNSTFHRISGYFTDDISETSGELPERIACAWVAPRFFEVWGAAPLLGRGFVADEERFGGPPAMVISARLWVRRFGSDSQILGRRLRVGNQTYPIVGVMDPSFAFPVRDVDVWAPSPLGGFALGRNLTWFTVIGRLRPGVSVGQAAADLNAVQADLGKQFPDPDSRLAVRLRPLKDATVGDVGRSLWILFGAVTLLLLIACTNVASLLLARTADRAREISIRVSLGASRAAIAVQLLTEALVLAVAGALAGLVVAAGAIRIFHGLAGTLPRMEEVHLNWTVVGYSLVCGVGITLLFGLLPVFQGIGPRVAQHLAQRSRTVASGGSRTQWLLVGIQVALAVTLLVAAGLLLRSFAELGRVSPGFETRRILTFRLSGNWAETGSAAALWRRMNTTLAFLRALPGVEDAATALAAPGVPFDYQIEVRLPEDDAGGNRIAANGRFVSAGYFSTMGIPLVAGEACRESGGPPSALVNRSFVERQLHGIAPIGRHIEQVPPNAFNPSARIVGIVENTREEGLNREPGPMIYWCNNAPVPAPLFLVRTRADAGSLAETLRRKVHEIEPARSVYEIRPLESHLGEAFSEGRLRIVLLSLFALSAVGLAAVGLYGTLSYLVNMRRREVGVRLALGASRSSILSRVLWQGLRVSVLGAIAGLALAALAGRALASMLYGVSPIDATTFASVAGLVGVMSLVASIVPAIRAARVEPVQVLRDE